MVVFPTKRFQNWLFNSYFVKFSGMIVRVERSNREQMFKMFLSRKDVLFFWGTLFMNLPLTLSTRGSVNLEFKVDRKLLLSILYSAAWNLLPYNYNVRFY